MVWCLRLNASNAGSLGSIPGQETRSRVLQLRPGIAKQINKNKYFLKDCGTGKKMSTVGQREPREYIQLVFYKGSKAVQWSKDSQYN